MDRRRAALEIYGVSGMFQQAAASFKASLPLFLTLALLSSVYETAVERSALLSGFSFSAQSSNFSLKFAPDPKNQAMHSSSHNAANTGGLTKFDTGDSLLSRLLTALLPPDDQIPHHVDVKQEELAGSLEELEDMHASSSELHTHMSLPEQLINDGDAQGSQGVQDRNHISFSSSTEAGGYGDEGSTLRLTEEARQEDNTGEMQQRMGTMDEFKRSYKESGMELDQSTSSGGILKHNDMHPEKDFEEFENVEDDTDNALPRLKIETVSNDTKKVVQESAIDAIDLTFFTGKLLGGRGLDQGAFPHGGLTMLIIILLLAVAVTVMLAVVGFQHAAVLGSVAYSVVSTHLGKRASARRAIKSSLKSSIGHLMWLAIMLAALSGLQSFFFMKTFFGAVMEMEQVELLVLRLSSAPFAILAPFNDVDSTSTGMAVRIGLFISCDYLFDGVAYCIYMVACWVTIFERNFWGIGAVMRSCNLVKGMEWQALVICLTEAILCGRTSRWLLRHLIGQFATVSLICTAQMYFLVLWLIFYMSARSLHDRPSRFSYRTLEDFLDRFK